METDIVSTMVFLHGAWDLVEEYWMKKDKEERDNESKKNVVVLQD